MPHVVKVWNEQPVVAFHPVEEDVDDGDAEICLNPAVQGRGDNAGAAKHWIDVDNCVEHFDVRNTTVLFRR